MKLSNEQILKKAIEKAVKGGWNKGDIWNNEFMLSGLANNPNQVIFSHDFAKAFWGDKEVCGYDGSKIIGKGKRRCCDFNNHYSWQQDFIANWEYELQQMVLEKEPLLYLERFL